MKSNIFTNGGGAGIGSYVIVLKNGSLVNPNPLRIRQEFDAGNTLYLSIIDDTTEQALVPLTGYVDAENKLHLTCRDFDDVKTYDFLLNGEDPIILTPTEGVTIGGSVIPTSGGASFEVLSKCTCTYDSTEDITTIVFPKYVCPLRFYLNDYGENWFFNYPDGEVLTLDGSSAEGKTIEINDSQMTLKINGEWILSPGEDSIEYCLIESSDWCQFNTLDFYQTKLYNMSICVRDSSEVKYVTFRFLTKKHISPVDSIDKFCRIFLDDLYTAWNPTPAMYHNTDTEKSEMIYLTSVQRILDEKTNHYRLSLGVLYTNLDEDTLEFPDEDGAIEEITYQEIK